MTRFFVLLMLLLVPIGAGCLGGSDDAVAPASTEEGAASSGPTGADAAAQTEVPATDGEAAAEGAGEPAFVAQPLDWDGKLPVAFCAPTGPSSCSGMGLTPGDNWHELDVSALGGGTLTLSWEAMTPLTSNLILMVFSSESCGDGCRSSTSTYHEMASGTSPVSLTLPAATLAEGETLSVYVRPERVIPPPVVGYVSVEQEFSVDGELLVPA